MFRLSTLVPLLMIPACDGMFDDFPAEYRETRAVDLCEEKVRRVPGIEGRLFYEVEHGGTRFDPSEMDSPSGNAAVEIARGLGGPLTRLAGDDLFVIANVTFDGWVIHRADCPSLTEDIYFVERFTRAELGEAPDR